MKIYLFCLTLFTLTVYAIKKDFLGLMEEDCELIETYIPEEPVINIPDMLPVPSHIPVSSYFGMRVHPVYKKKRMHLGIDFPLKIGTPVRATADGVVEKVIYDGKESTYGKHIQIGHDHIYSSLYAHLSNVHVTEGQMIVKGDTIGLSGNTGITTGPHLHVEIFKNGVHVNPLAFWKKNK